MRRVDVPRQPDDVKPFGLAAALLVGFAGGSFGAEGPSEQRAAPAKVQQLLGLLEDPSVRTWIEEQRTPKQARSERAVTASELAARIVAAREHFTSLARALPRLPGEVRGAAERLLEDLHGRHRFGLVALVLGFLVLAAGAEIVASKVTERLAKQVLREGAEAKG